MYQFIGEERNIFQLQLEASRFGKVKVEPMILEFNDSIGEDVHEVLDPIMLQSLSYQSPSCLDVDVQEISSIILCLK
jgi:hypothetical protein